MSAFVPLDKKYKKYVEGEGADSRAPDTLS
jgi:hypothetical protein